MISLISKYALNVPGTLYAAFIDLRAAFDSVSHARLWNKLNSTSMPKRLLKLIMNLYTGNSLYVKLNKDGAISRPISVERGVRQECVLAPHLFNLYLNDFVPKLLDLDTHAPCLDNKPVPALLYTDDCLELRLVLNVPLKHLLLTVVKNY